MIMDDGKVHIAETILTPNVAGLGAILASNLDLVDKDTGSQGLKMKSKTPAIGGVNREWLKSYLEQVSISFVLSRNETGKPLMLPVFSEFFVPSADFG